MDAPKADASKSVMGRPSQLEHETKQSAAPIYAATSSLAATTRTRTQNRESSHLALTGADHRRQ